MRNENHRDELVADSMVLTVEQMAATLHISRNTAYALAKTPGFPAFRIGTRLLVNRELLAQWINQQTTPDAYSA